MKRSIKKIVMDGVSVIYDVIICWLCKQCSEIV